MANKKHQIVLNDVQRNDLRRRLEMQTGPGRELRRARILLMAESGYTDKEISSAVKCSIVCVANLRKRFAESGFERALYDAPRSGAPQRFTQQQLDSIVDMANGDPPIGFDRWTLELICVESAKRGIVDSISIGRVYKLMKGARNNPNSLIETAPVAPPLANPVHSGPAVSESAPIDTYSTTSISGIID